MRVAISVDEEVVKESMRTGREFTEFEKAFTFEDGDRAEIHMFCRKETHRSLVYGRNCDHSFLLKLFQFIEGLSQKT